MAYKDFYIKTTSLADELVEAAVTGAPDRSLRPVARPGGDSSLAPSSSLRPIERPRGLMSTTREAFQDVADTFKKKGGLQRPEAPDFGDGEPTEDMIAKYLAYLDDVDQFEEQLKEYKPFARSDVIGQEALTQDREFMSQLARMQEKYPGLTQREIFLVIKGESSFNPRAVNKSGARGLFQLMPDSAREAGVDYDSILDMSPAEQLRAYEKYLDRWNYKGDVSLGVMQGAPAYRNASKDTVVYEVGSSAWKQNPGWRSNGNGPITVGSIDDYYRRQ